MSSRGRNTNEASPKKMIKWYTQQFENRVIERSRSKRLATERHLKWRLNYYKSARSPSEMQTSPCQCDIIIPTDTKVH